MEYYSQRRLMVVDDDADMVLSLQLLLENSGYRVDTFTDPLNALSEFKPNWYDLILLDMRMPHMNGFELYQALKNIDNTCKVCFVTAFETYYESLKEFFPNLDARCFIQKPVTKKRLLERVALEISHKES